MENIELLELAPEIAAATNDLPGNFPGDPLDRVIAATVKVMNLTLITCDAAICDAHFREVEFYPFKPSRLRYCSLPSAHAVFQIRFPVSKL